jgi:cyclomaltodextrinase / maltogenic alpha-amylase / neopullulanase
VSPDIPPWVRDAVFYQIFPDRFAASARVPKPGRLEPWDAPPTRTGFKGGDLLGIVERLDYLQALGVNALYLNPVFMSASNHRYHTYDYLAVDPLLGGDAALTELLNAAHGRGMRVVLDGVFNHTGRGFWPFHHILETGESSPYRSWFHLDEAALAAGRPLDAYPPTPVDRSMLGYEAWWGLPALPKLDTSNPDVREYLFGVAEHWLRVGIDGWRLDVPEEIADEAFWQEFRRRCRAIRPDAYLVGEVWHVAPDWLRGDRFDGLMDYPLAEAILGFAGGQHLDMGVISTQDEYRGVVPLSGAAFADRLTTLMAAYVPAVVAAQLNLLGSHDTPRLRSVIGGDPERVKLAMLAILTLPGAPCLYYGDEIGLMGGKDPACRGAFPWDATGWDATIHSFVRAAAALRAREPMLRADGVRVVATLDAAIVFERGSGDERLVVAINAGDVPARLEIPRVGAPRGGRLEAIDIAGAGAAIVTGMPDGTTLALDLGACRGSVLRWA